MNVAMNQACSIQNYGARCESVTVGHNPYKFRLSKNSLALPTIRPKFLCEHELELQLGHAIESAPPRDLMAAVETVMSARGADGRLKRSLALETFGADGHAVEALRRSITAGNVEESGRAQGKIEPLKEPFLGAWMCLSPRFKNLSVEKLIQRQFLVQSLYESRMASLQRLVGFFVMFHEMGKNVQDFWPRVTCGYLGYDMSRTQSITRVMTTASPVSGMEVRLRAIELQRQTTLGNLVRSRKASLKDAARASLLVKQHLSETAEDIL